MIYFACTNSMWKYIRQCIGLRAIEYTDIPTHASLCPTKVLWIYEETSSTVNLDWFFSFHVPFIYLFKTFVAHFPA